MFKKRYHREILTPTTPNNSDANLESRHNGVQAWVGGRDGHMGDVNIGPMDPVVWLHHSFIDYLLEKFRTRQKGKGINSEKDHPKTSLELHLPNRLMDNLIPQKRNIDGYSNDFTKTNL